MDMTPIVTSRLGAKGATLAYADRTIVDRIDVTKREWGEDRTVYCRSMLALRRMSEVESAQKEGCRQAAEAKRPLAGCTRRALARFSSQVAELEQVREVNERKLKRKWSPRLYAQIRCE